MYSVTSLLIGSFVFYKLSLGFNFSVLPGCLLSLRYFLSVFDFQRTIPFDLPVSGDGEIRTLDPLLARQVLSQLSYTPIRLPLTTFRQHS